MIETYRDFFFDAAIRALKTFTQALVALIGVVALTPDQLGIHELPWAHYLAVAALAALLSFLQSCGALPDIKAAQSRTAPQEPVGEPITPDPTATYDDAIARLNYPTN